MQSNKNSPKKLFLKGNTYFNPDVTDEELRNIKLI